MKFLFLSIIFALLQVNAFADKLIFKATVMDYDNMLNGRNVFVYEKEIVVVKGKVVKKKPLSADMVKQLKQALEKVEDGHLKGAWGPTVKLRSQLYFQFDVLKNGKRFKFNGCDAVPKGFGKLIKLVHKFVDAPVFGKKLEAEDAPVKQFKSDDAFRKYRLEKNL